MNATAALPHDATAPATIHTSRYARCINASKRVRWDIDADVIRGRQFDLSQRFLPSGLSKVDGLAFLSEVERRLLSQVQGRTYALIFGGSRTRPRSRHSCVSAMRSSSTRSSSGASRK